MEDTLGVGIRYAIPYTGADFGNREVTVQKR
jgi:hypothetical protein